MRETKTKLKKDVVSHFDSQLHQRDELGKEILLMIAVGIVIPAAFLMPNIPIVLRPLLRLLTKKCGLRKSAPLIRSITSLKKRGLVSLGEKDGQQVLTLSENGKKRMLQFNLDQMEIKRPHRWDGYWRIVIFDIPEKRREGRDALREKLKQLGFYQLQKSCFIHPFDCKSEIDYVSELFEVSPYVNFILAKEIEGTSQLKKLFGIR